jgi:hypothetical protein
LFLFRLKIKLSIISLNTEISVFTANYSVRIIIDVITSNLKITEFLPLALETIERRRNGKPQSTEKLRQDIEAHVARPNAESVKDWRRKWRL